MQCYIKNLSDNKNKDEEKMVTYILFHIFVSLASKIKV